MADEGWIKLYRKIMKSFVWTNSDQLKLWLLILMKANHSQNKFLFNGQEVAVSSGQFVTGRDALGFMFNEGVKADQVIAPRTLWRWLKKFESNQMLSIKSTSKYSVITVISWGEYQEGDQHLSSTCPAPVQHLSTNKNDKNEENEKNISSSSGESKSVFDFWEQNGFGTLSPTLIQKLEYWSEDLQKIGATRSGSIGLILKAMQVAVDNGVRKYSYLNSILRNWEQRGFKTTGDVDAYEASRKAKGKTGSSQIPANKQSAVVPSWMQEKQESKQNQTSNEEVDDELAKNMAWFKEKRKQNADTN